MPSRAALELAARAIALVAALGACRDSAAPASCRAALAGIWRVDAPGVDERWAIVEIGAALELYPLFDDSGGARADGMIVAPRRADLVRTERAAFGHADRWIERREHRCALRAAARITRCAGDTLHVELPSLPAPASLPPCPPDDTRAPARQLWRRVNAL